MNSIFPLSYEKQEVALDGTESAMPGRLSRSTVSFSLSRFDKCILVWNKKRRVEQATRPNKKLRVHHRVHWKTDDLHISTVHLFDELASRDHGGILSV